MENHDQPPDTFQESLAQYARFPANLIYTNQFPHALFAAKARLDKTKERLFAGKSNVLELFELSAGDEGKHSASNYHMPWAH